nr:flagellin [Bacillus cihuensis]
MIINHNIAALNTHRQLSSASGAQSKSMEKLASGLRINRAGDDAAGLAISEKMRGQIRGLDQASKNSQDGISMIQTAEGALNETHDILQRMRELANQAANDTNVGVDRNEIQKEINQLSSEINRIGNTTEFNTQSLLKGDGKANLAETGKTTNANLTGGTVNTTQATQTVTIGAAATNGQTAEFTLNGQKITLTFATNNASDQTKDGKAFDVTGNSATIYLNNTVGGTPVAQDETNTAAAIANALKEVIAKNDTLKGNFSVDGTTADEITVAATATGLYKGAEGNIAASGGTINGANSGTADVGLTTEVKATAADVVDFSGATTAALAQEFVGKGFTVGDKQIEFYNADKGAYTGKGIGVNISGVTNAAGMVQAVIDQAGPQVKDVVFSAGTAGKLSVTAAVGGKAGNDIRVTDGGTQEKFTANFQVGANKGQSMTIEIADMRSDALGITGKAGDDGFTASNTVTDGTSNNTKEAALDVSTHEAASSAIKVINDAIEKVSAQRSNLGAFQNRLEHTINNLNTSSENLTAAESRIRDVDMAKEMMEQTKNSILSQAAQAMLAQSNQMPQGVLQLLR